MQLASALSVFGKFEVDYIQDKHCGDNLAKVLSLYIYVLGRSLDVSRAYYHILSSYLYHYFLGILCVIQPHKRSLDNTKVQKQFSNRKCIEDQL